jgi:uncharacterized protein (TIGR02145 family)
MARNVGALNADTNAIFEALRAKGVTVPAASSLGDCAGLIAQINGGWVIEGEAVIGGRTYSTVELGDKVWMSQNLDLDFDGNHRYYNNDESTYGWNGLKYGALYSYSSKDYLISNIATIAPGWRMPTVLDCQYLISVAGVNGTNAQAAINLASTSGWTTTQGINKYKFNAVPCGLLIENSFMHLGNAIMLWTTTNEMLWISTQDSTTAALVSWSTNKYNSIRLVKDVT